MNIKNTVDLTVSEAVELLSKIAKSLEEKGSFHFDLKGQEVSVDAGERMLARLGISLNEFSIVFDWGEEAVNTLKTEQAEVEEEYHEPPQMIKEVKLPEEMEQEEKIKGEVTPKDEEKEKPTPVVSTPTRALPDRMPLNTTTLPLEGGFWSPAFTSNDNETQWVQVRITSELENKKWGTDEQITTLSDLTPSSAKPQTKRKKTDDDEDDLFSELDDIDKPSKKSSSKSSSQSSGVEKVTIPNNRASASPAASIGNIPQPTSKSKAADDEASSWREPTPEENATDDDWVKPSEVLKTKDKEQTSQPPSTPTSTPPSTTKSIPKPTKSESKSSGSQGIPKPKRKSSQPPSPKKETDEMTNEIREWREPSKEDNVTDDDWVKPSEFLKGKSGSEETESKVEEKINRPPPKAPDRKKNEDDEEKGWASWD